MIIEQVMFIIHILVDTSQIPTQDEIQMELKFIILSWSTTNIFTFTYTRSEYFKQLSKHLNYINYDISWITVYVTTLVDWVDMIRSSTIYCWIYSDGAYVYMNISINGTNCPHIEIKINISN